MEQTACEEYFWQRLEEAEKMSRQQKGRMAWFCSYTPVEIISSCGLQPFRFFAREGSYFSADAILHSSLCFFVRGCLEKILKEDEGDFEGAVLVNSCLSMSHLYFAMQKFGSLPFTCLLELPRHSSREAREFWANNLREFHHFLSEHFGVRSTAEDLWEQIYLYQENRRWLRELYSGREGEITADGYELIRLLKAFSILPPADFQEVSAAFCHYLEHKKEKLTGPRLFLTGSAMPAGLAKLIRELGGLLVLDDLCIARRMLSFEDEPEKPESGEDPYSYLARHYLARDPCARMQSAGDKLDRLEKMLKKYHIDGIIFFYLKFCDPWYYYGQLLKEKIRDIPVLVLEGDYSATGTGQMCTRISAFLEMLR